MSNAANQSADDAILSQVLQRSATDAEFRTRLISQPQAAIEEATGVSASHVNVRFVEKDASLDALIVLPDFVDAEGSLSDAELEAVAGGDWCITSCGWSICLVSNNNEIKVTTTAAA